MTHEGEATVNLCAADLSDLPRVVVEWWDANTLACWTDRDTLNLDVAAAETHGVLLEVTAEKLVVAGTASPGEGGESDQVHLLIAIPRGMVRRVYRVERGAELRLESLGETVPDEG